MKHIAAFIAPFSLLIFAPLQAEDLMGAEKALKTINETDANSNSVVSAGTALARRVERFLKDAPSLPPEKAAAEWLAIYDTYQRLDSSDRYDTTDGNSYLSIDFVISSLPPVASWDALAAAIDQRTAGKNEWTDGSLALFGSLLKSDPSERIKALDRLDKIIQEESDETNADGKRSASTALRDLFHAVSDPGNPIEKLRRDLDRVEKSPPNHPIRRNFEFPAVASDEAAPGLILRALKSNLNFYIGDRATQRLASKIALEHLNDLSAPPWFLVQGPEDVALYEAIQKKFPNAPEDDGWYDEAKSSYFIGLAATRRHSEAIELIKDPDILDGIELPIEGISPEYQDNILSFCMDALAKNPNHPLWDVAVTYATQLDKLDKFRTLVDATLGNPDLTNPKIREQIEQVHFNNLLDLGKNDEAIAFLDQQIEACRRSDSKELPELLVKSIRISRLLEMPDREKRDLDLLVASLPIDSQSGPSWEAIRLLIDFGYLAHAEKAIVGHLRYLTGSDNRHSSSKDDQFLFLAEIYDRGERHGDVIRLLDEVMYWPGKDLADISNLGHQDNSIQLLAARAFAKTGSPEKAAAISKWLINSNPGKDAAYEILNSLGLPDTIAFLDEMAAKNPFEERPLIWKAVILKDQFRFPEAEEVIRKAIAIDPSDGEQGKGDRMRAYAELGDVLEARKDKDQAAQMRRIVSAIRKSEKADDWWTAGLTKEAIRRYEEALEEFADAYCIQSRLARRYAESGEAEKAAQHYQRAFELMPDSFGRVESHCFGCEGTFTDVAGQKIAEKVFIALAAKPDPKPQVFYLLGQLRDAQSRYLEAMAAYNKAVELDPDYINAWKALGETATKLNVPQNELDRIALSQFRVFGDPSQLSGISDLRKLWTELLNFHAAHPRLPSVSLYPLPASAEYLKSHPQTSHYNRNRYQSPLRYFGNNHIIRVVSNMMDNTFSRY